MMRILVTEDVPGAAEHVDRALRAAGYDVVHCQRPGELADECVFFRGQGMCPLTLMPVDLAVDVRGAGAGPATVRELGALCAARSGIPLLVAGPADPAGVLWSRAVARCEPQDVVQTCAGLLGVEAENEN